MDILKELKEHSEELLKEDLDFFEIELATGNYDKDYIKECRELIRTISLLKEDSPKEVTVPSDDGYTRIEKKAIDELSKEELDNLIKKKIDIARTSIDYQERFLYAINKYNVDEEYIDNNFAFFKSFELNILIKHLKFSESFLEKYFKLLDLDVLAEYQLYSEEFFMMHYSKLNYKVVLKKSKNLWTDKKNRSSKLSIFLKLKGVSI